MTSTDQPPAPALRVVTREIPLADLRDPLVSISLTLGGTVERLVAILEQTDGRIDPETLEVTARAGYLAPQLPPHALVIRVAAREARP